jgi:hypothetical protein
VSFSLHTVAPRLARARDAWVAEQREIVRLRREEDLRAARLATQQLKLDRLVAHRELQYLRAASTGRSSYVATRARKLAAAKRGRERLE